MLRIYLKYLSLTLALLLCSNSYLDLPKILIIGDSISIGYTPFVKEHLLGIAEVHHNPGNAQDSGRGLEKIEDWLSDNRWDLVQFNWGLWDLCYRHPNSAVQGNRDKVNGEITFELEDYKNNLDSIVYKIKHLTSAKLVFLTTSYVPEGEAGRFHDDAIRYNLAALEVMEKYGVLVHDIYPKSEEIHRSFGSKHDNVHYTEEGYQLLGKVVSEFLEKIL